MRQIADARVVKRIVRMKVDGFMLHRLVLLVQRFEDEDDGDQHRETFLGEARDVSDQCAKVERDHEEQRQRQPHADPKAQLQVVNFMTSVYDGKIIVKNYYYFFKIHLFISKVTGKQLKHYEIYYYMKTQANAFQMKVNHPRMCVFSYVRTAFLLP